MLRVPPWPKPPDHHRQVTIRFARDAAALDLAESLAQRLQAALVAKLAGQVIELLNGPPSAQRELTGERAANRMERAYTGAVPAEGNGIKLLELDANVVERGLNRQHW